MAVVWRGLLSVSTANAHAMMLVAGVHGGVFLVRV
jgi:hypothetical protein